MCVRFFMMMTHYSSPLDFSNDALDASEKGFNRLMESVKTLNTLEASSTSSVKISEIKKACYNAMNDDFNTPVLLSHLFEIVRIINSAKDKKKNLLLKT